jgi:heterogeneous nuclear ribonucleoprotein A1/A3
MLRKNVFLAVAVTLLTLLTASRAQAWGAYHVGYTHIGPYGGIQHYGRTFYGGYGGYGGLAYERGGYGAVGYGGYGGAYYGGAYRAGYYRAW